MDGFSERFAQRKDEFEWLFMELYEDREALGRFETIMASFSVSRPAALKDLDKEREGKAWYLERRMLGVTMYTDLFAGNLKGLAAKVPYLKEMGVTYLHLMPLLKMPKEGSDGGYAVEDFSMVEPKFGTNGDLERLSGKLREAGISLCLDFVMNHTASTHAWAMRAKAGEKEYQDRYLVYPDRTIPDAFERTVPEVFPSTAPGNFIWDGTMRKWVFSSFYPTQWDLNYRNPVVFMEMLSSMFRLANLGVEVFRIDAVPYIWKELGTNCRNLPQVHTIVRLVRLALESVCPSVILKGEVVMAPKELAAYFGTPEKPECHLLYNVSTMVGLWNALASQDATLLKAQTEDILSLPPSAAWLNYLRCHDDIGWGLDEAKERSLGIDPLEHKKFLYHFFSGDYPGSYACGEQYNYDPVSQDARSCGTAASLCGIEQALEEKDEGKLKKALARMEMLYAVVYALKGFPMLSSGDEIAQLNDYSYKDDLLRKEDSRNVHRSPYDWDNAKKRKKKGTVQQIIWDALQNLRKVRSESPVFDGDASVTTWDAHNRHAFAIRRTKGENEMLFVSNFSDGSETVRFDYYMGLYKDRLTGRIVEPGKGFPIKNHEYLFLEKMK